VDLRRHVNRAAGRAGAALADALADELADELAGRVPPGGSAGGSASAAGSARTVILVDEPQRDRAVLAELRSLLATRPGAVVIATGWPDPAVDLGPNVVRTFGNGRANAAAAADALFGHEPDHDPATAVAAAECDWR
jgi:hypothetical protein